MSQFCQYRWNIKEKCFFGSSFIHWKTSVFRIYFFNYNVYESTQMSSVSNESLVSEWSCAISVIIYTGYGRFYVKREYKPPLIILYWLHVDMIVFA